MKKTLKALYRPFLLLIFIFFFGTLSAQTAQTFGYTGLMQTFVVPACVNSMTLEAWGAQGGMDANTGYNSNFGGYASAVFNVAPGTELNIFVGSQATSTAGGIYGRGDRCIKPNM